MFKDKTIVYTSGTFDMFHYNHLRMINYARSLADHRGVEDSRYRYSTTFLGSHGNREEAEHRRFRGR